MTNRQHTPNSSFVMRTSSYFHHSPCGLRHSLAGLATVVALATILLLATGIADEQPPAKRHVNRLAKETSPYLMLHAHNPVDWYPWGDEALAKAKHDNKLIFLSVGYSSCYWCHVMERESFMDEEIAAFLNKHFVCIKVDREERPDVDEIYMAALHALGRPGGWPLTAFLTPTGKPFFGGTYFPPRDKEMAPAKEGQPAQQVTGLLTLLGLIVERWQKAPDEVLAAGDQMAEFLKRELGKDAIAPQPLDDDVVASATSALADQFDDQFGGFGYSATNPRRPKFPEPSNLLFLLARARRAPGGDEQWMLVTTLEKMAAGGIRDHVGGGFHRYSTDRYWRVPHFEKMLYDNAQLASVYAEAWQLTQRDEFRQICKEILEFIRREMTDACGAFYSALDAETDGDEGAYYVWTREQIQSALEPAEYELFADAYGVDREPNFEGRYVIQFARPLAETAARRKLGAAALEERLRPCRQKLLAARNERKRPLTDTKMLTSANGLMIRGLADAGRRLGDDSYLADARRAADAVLTHLRTPEGRLWHTYTAGQARLNAYLDDYAFFIDGLLALHRTTGEERWLKAAAELSTIQHDLFWDDRFGGYFFTSNDHEALLARTKDPVDSATPSGNSVTAGNLVYLSLALDRPDDLALAEKTVTAFARFANRSPAAMPRLLAAWQEVLNAKKAPPPPSLLRRR
ncbi:MAG TPA: thioredoxin domain-containing protein [Pirellulales bacterium]|nr:thioredoxin domain-containing protein [Pirellulales bacterium]